MIILDMPLKKEWYNMIERGEKPEEYRVKSPYWIVRLLQWRFMPNAHTIITERITMEEARIIADEGIDAYCGHLVPKHYDAARFSYGYTKRRMLWEYRGLSLGQGRPEWGAPDDETFIIKLGKRL
ncbi:MAG: hypothetical protein V8Q54_05645 [Alistipes senegalensis]